MSKGNSACWTEDAAVEIEALQATYGSELDVSEQLRQISMLLLPYGDSSDNQHYVQCQLLFTLPEGYPSTAPLMQLQDVKGFTLRQDILLQQLQADAAELAGELLLGHLFESAKAWLTEHNHPEGPCIFCLEGLAAGAGSTNSSSSGTGSSSSSNHHQAAAPSQLMRLPCFHAFHESCFADWWCWQQHAYVDQQRALEAKTGATAAAALVQEALPPKDGPHFQLSCPTCRAPFQQSRLQQHSQQQLQHQLGKQQQSGSHGQQEQLHPEAAKLTAAQLQPFRDLQQRFAALFLQQQRRQGIIDTDVSYCIADWQQQAPGGSSTAGPEQPPAAAAAAASTNSAVNSRFGAAPSGPPRAGRSNNSSSSVGSSSRGGGRGRGQGSSRGGRSRGGRSRVEHSDARQPL